MEQKPGDQDEYNIFKNEDSSLEVIEVEDPDKPITPTEPSKPHRHKQQKLARKAITAVVVIAVLGLIGFAIQRFSPKPQTTVLINTQTLDNGTLNQLVDEIGGQIRQQLTITPDTIFKNTATIQGSAEVQKDLTIGGALIITGQTSLRSQVSILNSLSVTQNSTIGGNLSVNGQISAGSLAVGSLTLSSINLSGDIVFSGHIVPNGGRPSIQASVASGSGTATVTGNDTAGTIVINIGAGALNTGEMVIVTFETPFNITPKVQLTPVNAASTSLRYFATRGVNFFTIETATAPAAGASYAFDYLITQ